MDESGCRPTLLHPDDRGFPIMRGPVIHDPEHPPGRGIRLRPHHLSDKISKRGDPGRRSDLPDHPSLVYIVGSEIRQSPTPRALELHPPQPLRSRPQTRMTATLSLRLGLLIRADHIVVRTQWLPLPVAFVQIQDPSGFHRSPTLGPVSDLSAPLGRLGGGTRPAPSRPGRETRGGVIPLLAEPTRHG